MKEAGVRAGRRSQTGSVPVPPSLKLSCGTCPSQSPSLPHHNDTRMRKPWGCASIRDVGRREKRFGAHRGKEALVTRGAALWRLFWAVVVAEVGKSCNRICSVSKKIWEWLVMGYYQ